MEDVRAILNDFMNGVNTLSKEEGMTVQAFMSLQNAAFEPSALDVKTKELISVGIAAYNRCKYCIVACPYNVRYIREDTGAADHCNFCLDTRLQKGEDPACVSACRYDALVFGDVNDPKAFVTKLLDFKDSVRVRPQLGTKPSLRYIPLKKES